MALASGRTAPPFEVRNVRSPVCWAIAQQNLKWCSSATSACYGQNISKSVRVLVGSLVVLVPKCAKSSRCRCCGSIRRAVPKATETAENSEAEREAAWHRGCSSSSDMAEAISEVVAEWQQSFGRSQVGQVLEATQGSQGDFRWAPFTKIAELWHNWRAGAFGPITLAQVVKTSADQADLREAFKLFPDQGADVVYPDWRDQLRWEKPGRPQADEQWKAQKRRGAVAAVLRNCALELREDEPITSQEPNAFALLLVPCSWADELQNVAEQVQAAIGWPKSMPFLAVATQGSMLSLGTAMLPKDGLAPKPFFLGPREMEEAGAEGYRLQEQLDVGNKYYTKYWQEHGRTNGTVVACRMMHERRRNDVASILVFADPAAEAELTRQGMGLLDSAYPKAVKLGLVTAAASTSSAGNSGNSMSSMYMGGRFGGLRAGGVMGILLSNPADSAVGLCGCEVVGPFWEVFEYDSSPRSSVIKTVSDPKSSKLDGDGRRLAMTMAEAISELEEELGRALSTKDLWVGIRRGNARATRVEASASGEWALYKARQVLATGSLLLDGPGPGAEGVAGHGRLGLGPIRRAQLFETCEDTSRLGQLYAAFSMERAASAGQNARQPFVTLAFGAGDGPQRSIRDERLFGQLGLGLALLGAPGNVVKESMDGRAETDNPEPIPHAPTLIHRQAAGLLMLYSN